MATAVCSSYALMDLIWEKAVSFSLMVITQQFCYNAASFVPYWERVVFISPKVYTMRISMTPIYVSILPIPSKRVLLIRG